MVNFKNFLTMDSKIFKLMGHLNVLDALGGIAPRAFLNFSSRHNVGSDIAFTFTESQDFYTSTKLTLRWLFNSKAINGGLHQIGSNPLAAIFFELQENAWYSRYGSSYIFLRKNLPGSSLSNFSSIGLFYRLIELPTVLNLNSVLSRDSFTNRGHRWFTNSKPTTLLNSRAINISAYSNFEEMRSGFDGQLISKVDIPLSAMFLRNFVLNSHYARITFSSQHLSFSDMSLFRSKFLRANDARNKSALLTLNEHLPLNTLYGDVALFCSYYRATENWNFSAKRSFLVTKIKCVFDARVASKELVRLPWITFFKFFKFFSSSSDLTRLLLFNKHLAFFFNMVTCASFNSFAVAVDFLDVLRRLSFSYYPIWNRIKLGFSLAGDTHQCKLYNVFVQVYSQFFFLQRLITQQSIYLVDLVVSKVFYKFLFFLTVRHHLLAKVSKSVLILSEFSNLLILTTEWELIQICLANSFSIFSNSFSQPYMLLILTEYYFFSLSLPVRFYKAIPRQLRSAWSLRTKWAYYLIKKFGWLGNFSSDLAVFTFYSGSTTSSISVFNAFSTLVRNFFYQQSSSYSYTANSHVSPLNVAFFFNIFKHLHATDPGNISLKKKTFILTNNLQKNNGALTSITARTYVNNGIILRVFLSPLYGSKQLPLFANKMIQFMSNFDQFSLTLIKNRLVDFDVKSYNETILNTLSHFLILQVGFGLLEQYPLGHNEFRILKNWWSFITSESKKLKFITSATSNVFFQNSPVNRELSWGAQHNIFYFAKRGVSDPHANFFLFGDYAGVSANKRFFETLLDRRNIFTGGGRPVLNDLIFDNLSAQLVLSHTRYLREPSIISSTARPSTYFLTEMYASHSFLNLFDNSYFYTSDLLNVSRGELVFFALKFLPLVASCYCLEKFRFRKSKFFLIKTGDFLKKKNWRLFYVSLDNKFLKF